MFEPEEFYHGFQVNYFDYKQVNNQYLLNLSEGQIEKLITPIVRGNKEEFLRSIKADIRFTFLLSLETLFELIFGLLPDEKGKIHDKNLLLKILEKKPFYDEIRKFNNGENCRLDKLKKKVRFNNGLVAPYLRHIFYYGLFKEKIENHIESSIPVIENSLKVLAKELSNREELNSYKHGFRGIPFVKSFMTLFRKKSR